MLYLRLQLICLRAIVSDHISPTYCLV